MLNFSACASLDGPDLHVRLVLKLLYVLAERFAPHKCAVLLVSVTMVEFSMTPPANVTVRVGFTGEDVHVNPVLFLKEKKLLSNVPSHWESLIEPLVLANAMKMTCCCNLVRMVGLSIKIPAHATVRNLGVAQDVIFVRKLSGTVTTVAVGTTSTVSVTVTRRGVLRTDA